MVENLEKILNDFVGKDVNIYINGVVTTYLNFENFDFWVEEKFNLEEHLVLSSQNEEKYFTILLDEVRAVKINEDINEVRIIFNDLSLLQVWIDIE